MYEVKTKDVYEDFSSNKEMLDFSNYSSTSKNYDNSDKLVIEKMEDETKMKVLQLKKLLEWSQKCTHS